MWTEKKIIELKKAGNIKGFSMHKHKKQKNKPGTAKPVTIPDLNRSKEKEWLGWNLMYWANSNALSYETEYKFDASRRWLFDYAFPGIKVAVEYEGLFRQDKGKTGHSSISGVLRDIDKYNAAMLQGWQIIRVTAIDYKNVLQKLNEILCNK